MQGCDGTVSLGRSAIVRLFMGRSKGQLGKVRAVVKYRTSTSHTLYQVNLIEEATYVLLLLYKLDSLSKPSSIRTIMIYVTFSTP